MYVNHGDLKIRFLTVDAKRVRVRTVPAVSVDTSPHRNRS